jgi:hypothetical protein
MPTPTSLQADEFINRPGGPSRLAPAQQTHNKLKGSEVERRLDKCDNDMNLVMKGKSCMHARDCKNNANIV